VSSAGWINLLSPKIFFEYAPEEYKSYIESLYEKRVKKLKRGEKPKRDYSARRTAKGTLTITVRRKPKNLTRTEIAEIALSLSATEKIIIVENAAKKETK